MSGKELSGVNIAINLLTHIDLIGRIGSIAGWNGAARNFKSIITYFCCIFWSLELDLDLEVGGRIWYLGWGTGDGDGLGLAFGWELVL